MDQWNIRFLPSYINRILRNYYYSPVVQSTSSCTPNNTHDFLRSMKNKTLGDLQKITFFLNVDQVSTEGKHWHFPFISTGSDVPILYIPFSVLPTRTSFGPIFSRAVTRWHYHQNADALCQPNYTSSSPAPISMMHAMNC